MVWVTPITKSAGQTGLSADWNTYVAGNTNFLRDCLLGAQDLLSDWKISGTRNLNIVGAGVNHGMTTLATTDTYGAIRNLSPTAGGIDWEGYSDIDATATRVLGIIGSTTPTQPVVAFFAAKKNGTGLQALAASDLGFQFQNAGTPIANLYGSSGMNVIGGLSVGYSGVPAAAKLYVGGANFNLSMSGTDGIITYDTRLLLTNLGGATTQITGTQVQIPQGSSSLPGLAFGTVSGVYANSPNGDVGLVANSVEVVRAQAGGLLRFLQVLIALGGGAAPTLGTIGGGGPAAAAQNSWLKVADSTGAAIFIPVWK
jgi:hypothetical protein